MTNKQKKRLRNLLISLIGPILYMLVKYVFPDIPIPQADFIVILLAIIGLLVGGWNGIQLFIYRR